MVTRNLSAQKKSTFFFQKGKEVKYTKELLVVDTAKVNFLAKVFFYFSGVGAGGGGENTEEKSCIYFYHKVTCWQRTNNLLSNQFLNE